MVCIESPRVSRSDSLDAIGFVWEPFAADWEKSFVALEKFKADNGHCRVPLRHANGPLKLGQWVASQRKTKNTMPALRRRRLNAIGFVWRGK